MKTWKSFYLLALAATLAFTGCKKDDEGASRSGELTVGQTEYTLGAAEDRTAAATFTAPADWTLTVTYEDAADWLTVTPASGTAGEQTVELSAAENTQTASRTAYVDLACGEETVRLTVTQAAASGETDFTVNKKVHAAINAGLYPIICVGESLEQRELGVTMELIAYQVKCALAGVPADKMRHVVIAYEPLWAIGTGKTATAEQAGEVCQAIRAVIRKLYGAHVARSVTIQYGGSMNAKNAAELLAQPDVDGGLIGGASLKPADFVEIINAANQD